MTENCPLCDDEADLEFHHWDYDKNVGVMLCRECHNYIHEGEGGRVAVQQNRAEHYGGDHWHERAILQLIVRDLKHGGIEEAGVSAGEYTPHRQSEKETYNRWAIRSWSDYKERLEDIYNLPSDWTETADAPWFDPWPSHFTVALQHGRI